MQRLQQHRVQSTCPINYFVAIFGDKWSLVILRDIVFWGKVRHGEFIRSTESIATNILADRLLMLENEGIISKIVDPSDRRKHNYSLTQKGVGLVPVLLDIAQWSDTFGPQYLYENPKFIAAITRNRAKTVAAIMDSISKGGFIFERDEWRPLKT